MVEENRNPYEDYVKRIIAREKSYPKSPTILNVSGIDQLNEITKGEKESGTKQPFESKSES